MGGNETKIVYMHYIYVGAPLLRYLWGLWVNMSSKSFSLQPPFLALYFLSIPRVSGPVWLVVSR